MSEDVLNDDEEFKDYPPVANRPWIRICVDMLDHEIVGFPVGKPWYECMVWEWMLMEAARLDRKRIIQGKTIHLTRGQLAVSLRYLARKATWSVAKVRRFLGKLRRNGMIDAFASPGTQGTLSFAVLDLSDACPKSGTGITVITISNYRKFQDVKAKGGTGPARDRHRTGTGPAQNNTRYTGQRNTHRSPSKESTKKDTREDSDPSGTDGVLGERLPFTDEALAACEAMGFTREFIVARYIERTKRRRRGDPIRDPSAYLIDIAADLAAKKRGTSKDALRATLTKNTADRAVAFGAATGAPQEPSTKMRESVTRRCQRAKRDPIAMFASWQASIKGVRVLNIDQHVDSFCGRWLRGEVREAA